MKLKFYEIFYIGSVIFMFLIFFLIIGLYTIDMNKNEAFCQDKGLSYNNNYEECYELINSSSKYVGYEIIQIDDERYLKQLF